MQLVEVFHVAGNKIEFAIHNDGEATTRVNDRFDFADLPPRVGAVIIKKVSKILDGFLADNPEEYLWCSCFSGDGKEAEAHRERVFKWYGFTEHPGCPFILEFNIEYRPE